MAIVVVTGTPGTGKTTVAMRLANKLGCRYVDVNKVISEHKLAEKYDKKKQCNVVDEKKLARVLVEMIKKAQKDDAGLVIDSHLAHYVPAKHIDLCVVTKCDLKRLRKRLKLRKYNEKKVEENMQCEIFDVCLNEAREAGHDVVIVETDGTVDYEKLADSVSKAG
jgi:adenylate kinase